MSLISFGNVIGNSNRGGGAASYSPSFINDVVLWINPNNTKTLFKKTVVSQETVTAPALIDDDAVSFLFSQDNNGIIFNSTIARSPLLKSEGGRNSLKWNGTNGFGTLSNTKSILRPIHEANTTFSIMGWVKKATDGTLQYLCDSSNNTTANTGFNINFTTGNKLSFQIYYASPGLNKTNATSTASITVADGWVPFVITVEGNGASAGTFYIGDNTPQTFNVNNVGTTSLMFSDVIMGARASTTTGFTSAYMGDFFIINRLVTSEEIAEFKAFNPPRYAEDFTIDVVEYAPDSGYVFSDAAGTTPASDAGSVQRMNSKLGLGNFGTYITKYLSNDGAAMAVPVLDEVNATINNKASLYFDGTDTVTQANNTTLAAAALGFGELVPVFTEFIVVRNKTDDPGSHILSQGSTVYWVVTGSAYSGNSLFDGDSYQVVHQYGAFAPSIEISKINEEFNVLAFSQNVYTGKALVYNETASAESDIPFSSPFPTQWSNLGKSFKPVGEGWDADMDFCYYKKVYGYMSESQKTAKIADLKTYFGI